MDDLPTYGFDELCALVELPSRTVRYYIQMGLVDRPDGLNRGARYTARHVEQLLTTKKWQAAGLSLDRIRDLLHGEATALPPTPPKTPGTIEFWSRLQIAPGIELSVEAGVAGLSPEELRNFFRKVLGVYQETRNTSSNNDKGHSNE